MERRAGYSWWRGGRGTAGGEEGEVQLVERRVRYSWWRGG